MIHRIESNWKSGVHFEVKTDQGLMNIDGAEEIGGQGKGYRPKQLMLVSLAGCTGIDVTSLIKKMRIDVDAFSIEVEGDLTDEHPKKYSEVKIKYSFSGANLDKEKLTKAVNLSTEKYCGVIAMFKSFAKVEIEIQFN